MADPKGFLKYPREGPKRRPVELRVQDWKEFYEPISEDKLKAQGARCMDCGVPFCQSNHGCPVVNLIPEWNDLVHRGRWKDALKALHTTNNIPDFKMEKWVIDRRLEQMKAEGVKFQANVHVGVDISGDELRRQFDSVCLALGAEQGRELPVPGRELEGIHPAMDYLVQQNKRNAGDVITEEPITAKGKRVVIIGGGDTGSDCLGTTHRQGCLEVHQFELLPEPPPARAESTPWPLWPMQLRSSHAHEEGCDRQWSVSTTRFSGHNGHVTKLHAHRVTFENGRFIPMPGTEFEMEVNLVLLAMGFTGPVKNGLLDSLGVKYDARGNVAVDENYMTSEEGVFAGGDVKRGASLIVWAIAEGRKMAAGVDKYLRAGQQVAVAV